MVDYSITQLDISKQYLTKLPDDIDKYANLKNLNCSWNELTSLDNLPHNLQELNCSENKLSSLDNLPPNLQELHCGSNLITSLDNLPSNLKILYCGNNKNITDEGIKNIPNLQFIKLRE